MTAPRDAEIAALRERCEKAEKESGRLGVVALDAQGDANVEMVKRINAEAERDRLREAIEKIAAGVHETWKDANCERIARAALEGR